MKKTEIRGFLQFRALFEKRGWPFPYCIELQEECSALDLAKMIDLPLDKIEAVFINGLTQAPGEAQVKPGDRVGFVPYGTPGVVRLMLKIKRSPEDNCEQD